MVLLLNGSQLRAEELGEPGENGTPREQALEHLLSERESLEALEKSIVAARELGVGDQAILEARFLFHVDQRDDEAIAALVPEFMRRKETFDMAESEIFATVDDWLAVTEYVQSIAALQKGDQAAFKKHITEAFWLSPRQGAAFAPHIDRIRLKDAMKGLRVDFERKFRTCLVDGEVSLGEVLGKREAMLLHFWSPWSRECEVTLPEFMVAAEYLEKKGIAVVSVLPETTERVIVDARMMLAELKVKLPGGWLVDFKKESLTQRLRVQSVPTMVLLSTEGAVLFNGHPADEMLWQALAKINEEIERPEFGQGED